MSSNDSNGVRLIPNVVCTSKTMSVSIEGPCPDLLNFLQEEIIKSITAREMERRHISMVDNENTVNFQSDLQSISYDGEEDTFIPLLMCSIYDNGEMSCDLPLKLMVRTKDDDLADFMDRYQEVRDKWNEIINMRSGELIVKYTGLMVTAKTNTFTLSGTYDDLNKMFTLLQTFVSEEELKSCGLKQVVNEEKDGFKTIQILLGDVKLLECKISKSIMNNKPFMEISVCAIKMRRKGGEWDILVGGNSCSEIASRFEKMLDGKVKTRPPKEFKAISGGFGSELLSSEEYTTSITSDERNPMLYRDRAKAYEKEGDIENASKDYGKLIELMPGSTFYNLRADFYMRQSEFDKAVLDYTQAAKFAKQEERLGELASILGERAKAYFCLNKNKLAKNDCVQSVKELASGKDWRKTLLIGIILGLLSGHRFYTGRIKYGIFGLFPVVLSIPLSGVIGTLLFLFAVVLWLIDIISLLKCSFNANDGIVMNDGYIEKMGNLHFERIKNEVVKH